MNNSSGNDVVKANSVEVLQAKLTWFAEIDKIHWLLNVCFSQQLVALQIR